MLSIVPTEPWTTPLNWHLQASAYGETRIPFAAYVRLESTRSLSPTRSICTRFCALPAELQLHIFRYCDSPTLFCLMQVSRTIRVEARKLFWADTTAWYNVHGGWLLSGAFPGHAFYALEPLAYVEQVEVGFAHIKDLWSNWKDGERAGTCGPLLGDRIGRIKDYRKKLSATGTIFLEERIRNFWLEFQHQCPRATRIVLSESWPRESDRATLPADLQRVVRLCPTGLTASASLLQREAGCERRMSRRLWQRVQTTLLDGTTTDDTWAMTDATWSRSSILLPPKVFRGPVGDYDRLCYQSSCTTRRRLARQLLLIEALERHHFHERCEPFVCPASDCEARFELPGQWPPHAIDSGHHESATPPDHLKESFSQYESRIGLTREQYAQAAWSRMKSDWGEKGCRKRRYAERAFLHQLEHDPLYAEGKPARQNSRWCTMSRNGLTIDQWGR